MNPDATIADTLPTAETRGGCSLQRSVRRRRDLWNKCHECGRIIPYADFESGQALNRMITPDSDVSYESWEILCRDHYKPSNAGTQRPGSPDVSLATESRKPGSLK